MIMKTEGVVLMSIPVTWHLIWKVGPTLVVLKLVSVCESTVITVRSAITAFMNNCKYNFSSIG